MANRLVEATLQCQKLITIFLVVLIISSREIKAQERNDSYIYSIVIDSLMNKWAVNESDKNKIVFIKKFKPVENYANYALDYFDTDTTPRRKEMEVRRELANQSFLIQETIGSKKIYRECNFDCYGNLINNNIEIRKAIENLEGNFYDIVSLDDIKFNINREYHVRACLKMNKNI